MDWSNIIIELSLPQRVAKTAGGLGLSFHWDAFGIEWMVREKMVVARERRRGDRPPSNV